MKSFLKNQVARIALFWQKKKQSGDDILFRIIFYIYWALISQNNHPKVFKKRLTIKSHFKNFVIFPYETIFYNPFQMDNQLLRGGFNLEPVKKPIFLYFKFSKISHFSGTFPTFATFRTQISRSSETDQSDSSIWRFDFPTRFKFLENFQNEICNQICNLTVVEDLNRTFLNSKIND